MINTLKKYMENFKGSYYKRARILKEEGLRPYLFNSNGYVLVIVLVVTTLLVSISSEFIIEAQTNIGFINKFDHRLKARFLARSGIELGKYILYADKMGASSQITGKSSDKAIDSYKDIWAMDMPPFPLDEGTVKIKIEDENSKIYLSGFANEYTEEGTKFYKMGINFFYNMGFQQDLADAIKDWVDVDDSRSPYVAETYDYYSNLNPPYKAKNAAMDSIDELLMVKGFTPEIFYGLGGGNAGQEENLVDHNRGDTSMEMDQLMDLTGESDKSKLEEFTKEGELPQIGKEKSRRLSDYFRVHGERRDWINEINRININTASYRVLSALTEEMGDDIVTEIISRRLAAPFKSVSDIGDLVNVSEGEGLQKQLTTKSYIFKIHSTATVENATITVTTVFNRDTKKVLYWSEE